MLSYSFVKVVFLLPLRPLIYLFILAIKITGEGQLHFLQISANISNEADRAVQSFMANEYNSLVLRCEEHL